MLYSLYVPRNTKFGHALPTLIPTVTFNFQGRNVGIIGSRPKLLEIQRYCASIEADCGDIRLLKVGDPLGDGKVFICVGDGGILWFYNERAHFGQLKFPSQEFVSQLEIKVSLKEVISNLK